jgi:hypothetical protein
VFTYFINLCKIYLSYLVAFLRSSIFDPPCEAALFLFMSAIERCFKMHNDIADIENDFADNLII